MIAGHGRTGRGRVRKKDQVAVIITAVLNKHARMLIAGVMQSPHWLADRPWRSRGPSR